MLISCATEVIDEPTPLQGDVGCKAKFVLARVASGVALVNPDTSVTKFGSIFCPEITEVLPPTVLN